MEERYEINRCYDCGGLVSPLDEDFDQAVCRCFRRKVRFAKPERAVDLDLKDVLSSEENVLPSEMLLS